jgi:3-oxoadipate enol-lactonase
VPTLVIVGSSDVLTPVQNSEAIAARIPGARLVVLEGAAHIANLDQPDEFTNALNDFLEEVA